MKIFTILKKIPKKISIPLGITLATTLAISTTLMRIETVVEKISTKYINGRIKIENVDLSLTNTKIENIKLYDDKNNVLAYFPKVEIKNTGSSLLHLKIDEIKVNSGDIYVVRDKEGKLNFQKLIENKKKEKKEENKKEKKKKEEKNKEYKPKSLPINKINIENIKINYTDEKLSPKLNREINNISAHIISNKVDGIDAKILVNSDNIKLNTEYRNKEKPIDLKLNIEKFLLDKDLLQSLVNKPELHFSDINIKSDLSVLSDKKLDGTTINGTFSLDMPNFKYDNLDTEVKNISLKSVFLGKDGEVVLKLNIFNTDKEFKAVYKNKELNSIIVFDRVDEKILNSFIPLRKKNLDFKNINIEDIKTIIHYSDEKGLTVDTSLKANESKYSILELDDFKVNASLKDGLGKLDVNILTKIKNIDEKISIKAKNEKEKTELLVQLNSLDKNSLLPNINLKSTIENKKDNIKAIVDSNIVDFSADYLKNDKKLKVFGNEFLINYSVKEKKITDGKGKIPFEIYNLVNYLDFDAENNKVEVKELRMADKDDKKKNLVIKGEANLDKKTFNFDYVAENAFIQKKIDDKDIKLNFTGNGKITGEKINLESLGKIDNLSLEYIGKINEIKGNYQFNKNKDDLKAKFLGEIKNIGYKNYTFKDFKLDVEFLNKELIIKNFKNKQILFKGKYNIKEKDISAEANIDRLSNKDINLDKVGFLLENFRVKINGKIDNPKAYTDLGTTIVTLPNKAKLKVTGKVELENGNVRIKGININNGSIKGNYLIKDKKLNLNASLNEKKLSELTGGKDLGYALQGNLKVNGVAGNLNAELSGGILNDFSKNKYPDIIYKMSYKASNYSDGIVNLENISLSDRNLGEILTLIGRVDLKNKTLDIRNRNNKINLEKIANIINQDLVGILDIDLKANGNLKNPNYSLLLNSNEIKLKDIPLRDLSLKINGDIKKAKINDMRVTLYGNVIKGLAEYDIENKKYFANINSEDKIEIKKLKPLLEKYNLTKLDGNVILNAHIDEKNRNIRVALDNISLSVPKYYIDVKGTKGEINIKNENLTLDGISSKINGAPLEIKGEADLKNVSKIDKNRILKDLPYKFILSLKDFKYEYPKVAKVNVNVENMLISNKGLKGNIVLKNGILYDIPNDYKSAFSIIKSQLEKRKKKKNEVATTKIEKKESKNNKDKKDIQKALDMLMPIDLSIQTEKPFVIDMDNFNLVVPEIYGNLDIDLALKGRDGRYFIDGETELKDGYMFVNTNEFKINRALITFNENSKIPDINPNIFFETSVEMDDDEYTLEVYGLLKKLRYSLKSKYGKTGGDLNGLITHPNSDGGIYIYGTGNEVFLNFMKNLVAGQLVETVVGSARKYTKRKLDLTRLVIKPEVTVYNTDRNSENSSKEVDKDNTQNNRGQNKQIYSIALNLEAKDNIYKNKLFWYAKAKVLGTGRDVVNQTMTVQSKMREYDVGLEYKIDESKSVEVGVGTIQDKYRTDENKNYRKNNYHVGYKIRKRYKSFSEIFSF